MASVTVPQPIIAETAQNTLVMRSLTRRHKVLLFLFVTLFATEFLIRGPGRFFQEGSAINDFISPFVQSKAWLEGTNPYSPAELVRLWPKGAPHLDFLSRDAAAGTLAAKDGIPSPYPLTCFLILAPIAHAPWPAVHIALLATNVLCALLFIGILVSFLGLGRHDPRTYLLWGLGLGLAPLHTAIAAGNLIVIVCACAAIAMWCARRNRNTAAGILLAVATCLKPQVGLLFLAYYAIRQRWCTVLVGATVTMLAGTVAILRLVVSGTPGVQTYLADLNNLFAVGAINDFSRANPLRFHLLNLQMPLGSIVDSRFATNVFTWAVVGVLVLGWVAFVAQHNDRTELLDLSAIATIALLPVYHRFVDGLVLMLPLCWCLTVRGREFRRIAWLTVVFVLLFLIPGASLLATLVDRGYVSSQVASTWWWNTVVIPYQSWTVLALAITLVYAMNLRRLVTD